MRKRSRWSKLDSKQEESEQEESEQRK
jgi:hypothetical protein